MQQYAFRKYLFDVGPVFKEYNGIFVIPYIIKHMGGLYYPAVVAHPSCPFWHQTGTLTCLPAGVIESQRQREAPVMQLLGPADAYRMLRYSVGYCDVSNTAELKAECVQRTLHYAECIKMWFLRTLQRVLSAVKIQRQFRKTRNLRANPQKMFEAFS